MTLKVKDSSVNAGEQFIKGNQNQSIVREEANVCPECGGTEFETDSVRAEIRCRRCGLVIEENLLIKVLNGGLLTMNKEMHVLVLGLQQLQLYMIKDYLQSLTIKIKMLVVEPFLIETKPKCTGLGYCKKESEFLVLVRETWHLH